MNNRELVGRHEDPKVSARLSKKYLLSSIISQSKRNSLPRVKKRVSFYGRVLRGDEGHRDDRIRIVRRVTTYLFKVRKEEDVSKEGP